MTDGVLHQDDPYASVTLPDGRVIRNLTAEEYAATLNEGTPHGIPADELAKAVMRAQGKERDRHQPGGE